MKLGIAVVAINLASALMAPIVAWPGDSPVRFSDQPGALGGNISGLTLAGASSLWAVRDGPGQLLRLDRTNSGWASSSEPGSTRTLHYADGTESPDAEAVTTANGDDTIVYVASERDSDKPNTSRNSILRFDTANAGTLRATLQWELNSVLPATGANTGIEGLAWVPDDVFVAMSFRDATGKVYAPADYPDHGKGLFVVGLEQNAALYVIALRDNGTAALVASMPSGLNAVMEVVWSPARQELWALCDDTCAGVAAVLKPSGGSFVLSVIVEPPPGMATLNNEGFALGQSCTDGAMFAIWADDRAADDHVLRETTLPCTPISSATAAPNAPSSSTQPSTSRPSSDSDPSEDRSSAVLVAVAVALAAGAGAAIALRRRARSCR